MEHGLARQPLCPPARRQERLPHLSPPAPPGESRRLQRGGRPTRRRYVSQSAGRSFAFPDRRKLWRLCRRHRDADAIHRELHQLAARPARGVERRPCGGYLRPWWLRGGHDVEGQSSDRPAHHRPRRRQDTALLQWTEEAHQFEGGRELGDEELSIRFCVWKGMSGKVGGRRFA